MNEKGYYWMTSFDGNVVMAKSLCKYSSALSLIDCLL